MIAYQRLLVTGAGGFVGSHVVTAALARGYKLRSFERPTSPGRGYLDSIGIEVHNGDLTDGDALRRAIQGCDAIVHCAAHVGDWGHPAVYRRVNVDSLKVMADAAADAGVKTFVLMSSLGVYPARHHYGTDESAAMALDGLDAYTRTKAEAEVVLREVAQSRGLHTIMLRPGFVYGPRDRRVLPRLLETLRAKRFAYIGDGMRELDQIYVGNLVDAVFLALDAPRSLAGEAFNLTDPELVTRREFVGTVARLAGLPEPRLFIPERPAYVLTNILDRAGRLLRLSEPLLLSKARYKFLALNLNYSTAKARNLLGYAPRYHFPQAMAETMAWFSDHVSQQVPISIK
jgi:nucleoside-diphosphate-sugar epimerase